MPHIPRLSNPSGEYPDFIKRMRVYQVAIQLLEDAWNDAEALAEHRVTHTVGAQLYTAVGSIAANLGEGYSRSSGRDRARFFEYALGSARESTIWYKAAARVLDPETVAVRDAALEEIKRLLQAIIPRERDCTIRPRPTQRSAGS